MTIADVERETGLARANIRFYEKEGLLSPARGENGYREYTEEDVRTLQKIKLLRQLRMGVPLIRQVQRGELTLADAVRGQLEPLLRDIREAEQARAVCQAMSADGVSWDGLDPAKYLALVVLPARGDSALESDRLPPAGAPWRRYFARSLDLSVYGILVTFVEHQLLRWNPSMNPIASILEAYCGLALMLLLEPLLLHLWGTTPGKWIFGLSVRTAGGQKLDLQTAFARTYELFRTGLGYGVPIYSLYREYRSYRACTERELCWDEDYDCAVCVPSRETHPGRVAAYLVSYALVFAVTLGVLLRAELPPHRGELTVRDYIANCNDFLKYRDIYGRIEPDGSWNPNPDEGTNLIYVAGDAPAVDISLHTDEAGNLQAVTLRIDSTGYVDGGPQSLQSMVFYAYAMSHERAGLLRLARDPMREHLDDSFQSFEVGFGSLRISRTVEYSGYEAFGGQLLWPQEGMEAEYHLVFSISKA